MNLLEPPSPKGPAVEAALVERLIAHLRDRKWVTAADCCEALGLPTDENGKRILRQQASHSGGRIIGGQKGYCHIQNLTRGEYWHWRNAQLAQCTATKARVTVTDRLYFSR